MDLLYSIRDLSIFAEDTMESFLVKVEVNGLKKVVVGKNLSELLQKAREKFGTTQSKLFFSDGTELDEDGMVLLQRGEVLFMRNDGDYPTLFNEFPVAMLSTPRSSSDSTSLPDTVLIGSDIDLDSSLDEDHSQSSAYYCKEDSQSDSSHCKDNSQINDASCKANLKSNASSCSDSSQGNAPSCKNDSQSNALYCEHDTTKASFWQDQFAIPWGKFPNSVMAACKKGVRPDPGDRREMIRCLAREIHDKNTHPGRKNLATVCQKLTSKYPKSFEDRWGDKKIGEGYKSLLNQIENKLNDFNRRAMKRASTAQAGSTKKGKSKKSDSYGCINFCPTIDKEEETLMKDNQSFLQEAAKKDMLFTKEVHDKLKQSFPLQRKLLSGEPAPTMEEIKINWPHLLEYDGLIGHASMLLGFELQAKFFSEVKSKGPIIDKFVRQNRSGKKNLSKAIEEVDSELVDDSTRGSLSWIRLIPEYFGEDIGNLITVKECLAGARDPELNGTPFVAVLDGPLFTGKYFLVVDGLRLNKEAITNPLEAILALFAAHYTFNLKYTDGVAITYEFIQRFLAGINPEKGSKTKRSTVNPHLLSFLNKIQSFQWNL